VDFDLLPFTLKAKNICVGGKDFLGTSCTSNIGKGYF